MPYCEDMSQNLPPPPAFIQKDAYSAADPARRRLISRSRFPRFLSLPNLRSLKHPPESSPQVIPSQLQENNTIQQVNLEESQLIHLDASQLNEEEYQDKYEWAIVYENQRGVTVFSVPYYSRLSLLPSDPSPFTTPNTSPKRSEQPPISLVDYPLPDGDWRWVSKCWMIDMRSDSGEVQHDGFEYNWFFRTHKWRSGVGALSSGGWVRRRRWVRLMMRPSRRMSKQEDEGHDRTTPTPTIGGSFSNISRYRNSGSPSLPRSLPLDVSIPGDVPDLVGIWLTNDVELNWTKYRYLMKYVGRDGQKLEIWKAWLGKHHHQDSESVDQKGKARQKQWTEDDIPMPSEQEVKTGLPDKLLAQLRIPPKEYIVPLLRIYGGSLLRLFIFPESRAEFLNILGEAGMLPELDIGSGRGASEVDFWSYGAGLRA